MELKPCPFCGSYLEKHHFKHQTINGAFVEYDYYEHPLNDCILSDRISEMSAIRKEEVEKWNCERF